MFLKRIYDIPPLKTSYNFKVYPNSLINITFERMYLLMLAYGYAFSHPQRFPEKNLPTSKISKFIFATYYITTEELLYELFFF